MQQDFDRVITRVDGSRERLPVCFCRADKLGFRRVVRNTPVKASYLKSRQPEIRKQENEKRSISATYPEESPSPFRLPDRLRTATSPAFWQEI